MSENGRVTDKYSILAPVSIIDPYRLILKDGDLFGVFDRFGDIMQIGKKEQGLYFGGTRFISGYELRLNGARPLFLSSNIDEQSVLLTVDLTNPDLYLKNRLAIPKDSVHIMRSRLLVEDHFHEYLRIRSFALEEVEFSLELEIDADFRDIFEIRGVKRKRRGSLLSPEHRDSTLILSYDGLDGIKRAASISFSRKPDAVRERTVEFNITLPPEGMEEIFILAGCTDGVCHTGIKEMTFDESVTRARKKVREWNRSAAQVHTSNEHFNKSFRRSVADINMMLTETLDGLYPYGGIPWFCTPFGRDGIITALECLWLKPDVARGVLTYLGRRQASEYDTRKAAEPGKILHEARLGEMAALGEIPFGLYYGSVDSTPLYIILAGAYWRRTADTALIKKIWKHIEYAIHWMDYYGDVDGDGFVEYIPDEQGLRNQGWKDSQDSVFHENGALAEGPIALCEVQAYAYAARMNASFLASILGKEELSIRLAREAAELKIKFNEVFWDESLGCYILALDRSKRPCRVISSNAGHTLLCGIADPDKAARVARVLTTNPLFSGWGIRTVSAEAALYNPMSYHNGSVWPHDNALSALGLSNYGLKDECEKVFTGIFEASLFMEFHRLPELFCGFHRREGSAPTLYPVACSPQTWASGALLLFLQASLGIEFTAAEKKIVFREPTLPRFLSHIQVTNFAVTPKKTVDLFIRRYGKGVTIEVLKKPADVTIQIIQ